MTLRSTVGRSVRRLFTAPALERALAKGLQRRPASVLARKLVPENSWFPPGSWRTVTRHGVRFRLDLSDYEDWLLYFHSEVDSSLGVLEHLGDSRVIVDVGANIGQTALIVAKRAGPAARIIAFEPYPETFDRLVANLALNPGLGNVVAENLGLGDAEASTPMFKDYPGNSGGNRVVYDAEANRAGVTDVRITTLDRYVETRSVGTVDFVKIDVEGYERAVLAGARTLLAEHRPKLFIELDDDNLRKQGASAEGVIGFLRDHGYRTLDARTREEISPGSNLAGHRDVYCEPPPPPPALRP